MREATNIEVIGHGGAAAFYPGNSEASIRKALDIGVDRIEVDVRVSRDRELILIHDDEFHRDGVQKLASRTSIKDLRKLHPELICLQDAFEIVAGRVPLLIDIKDRGYEPELIDLIRRMYASVGSTASSTHARSLRQLHEAFPTMRIGLSRGHSMTKFPIKRHRWHAGAALSGLQTAPLIAAARWCGASELMLQYHFCNRLSVTSGQSLGFRVYPWTVDTAIDIDRMVRLKVDGVISNRPDLVRERLEYS